MAKFKKLAILCTALVMSAGLATAAACAEDAPSSTPSTESSSADSSTPETSEPEDSSSEDSSEDSSGGEATTTYTVTVDAPAGVTVGGTLTAETESWSRIFESGEGQTLSFKTDSDFTDFLFTAGDGTAVLHGISRRSPFAFVIR